MLPAAGTDRGDFREALLTSFTASDGARLAYYIDDFTDPWRRAPTLLLLHAAMGSAKRYYAWVPALAAALSGGADGSARAWRLGGAVRLTGR